MTASYRAVPPHDVSTSGLTANKAVAFERNCREANRRTVAETFAVRAWVDPQGKKEGRANQGPPAHLSFKPQLRRQDGTSFAVEAFVTARPQLAEMTGMICTEMLDGVVSAIIIFVITIAYL
ncbi:MULTISPECIES: hypothetical protein [unclassified Mesorhizobium]|uniref:hypothetical protein n=1 Tax=unclassified Mesorhizobium TaxID=325217 RepID=UPI00333DCB47